MDFEGLSLYSQNTSISYYPQPLKFVSHIYTLHTF